MKKKKLGEKLELLKLDKINLIKKINTLELEISTLQETLKDELYKTFMEKLSEPCEMKRLKDENKKLRKRNKVLLAEIRESHE